MFHGYAKSNMPIEEVVADIVSFVREKPERNYKIIVGTDSASQNPVGLVTAFTIWRVGN